MEISHKPQLWLPGVTNGQESEPWAISHERKKSLGSLPDTNTPVASVPGPEGRPELA